MSSFRDRLYISTMAEDAAELAAEYAVGLEIAEFCAAYNMDTNYAEADKKARRAMNHSRRFTFHAPFSELCPAAIDPLVRDVTKKRYRQAIALAHHYGICRIVIHAGFIPQVYFPEWFVPQSIAFWQELLADLDASTTICLENVMEPSADMLVDIVRQTNDPRLRLCLDVGHACTRPNARPVEDWLEKEAPFLDHFHIHNNDGVTDLHDPLDRGILDMAALIEKAESLCPEATYTIENLKAAESLVWLRGKHYI